MKCQLVALALLATGCSAADRAETTSEEQPPPDSPEPTPDDCPADVVCLDALPFEQEVTIGDAPSHHDTHACAPNEATPGSELAYRFDLAEAAFVTMQFDGDASVVLLEDLDGGCIDHGAPRAAAWLDPGRYFAMVDGTPSATATLSIYAITVDMIASTGIDADVARRGLRAFAVAWEQHDTSRFEYAMSDFSLRSHIPRQWAFDLRRGDLLWNLHLPHGDGSKDPTDSGYAITFSNIPQSHQSSLGMMRAGESYVGDFGYSFRLDGLEPGYNDEVRDRAIVVHPSEGSRAEYVAEHGEALLTWGCPALDDRYMDDIVDTMKDGALLWFWYPDGDWSDNSLYR